MFNKLKQFKELKDQAKALQETLANEKVTISEAHDKVVLTMDGNLTLLDLTIDDSMLTADKKQELTQAIKDAHKKALKKIQTAMALKMREMGGLPNIPGLS